MVKLMLPISSMNSVPPWAAWKSPSRFALAPVNAPFVYRPRYQFLSRTAFPSDQYPARLRRHGLDQLKDRTHLGALSDDVVESSEPAQFTLEIACLFLPFEAVSHPVHGAA